MWTKIIQLVADQLCHPLIIRDYDVAYLVAENYVSMRIEDSTEECRHYHFDRLTIRIMPDYFQRQAQAGSPVGSIKNIKDEQFNTFRSLLSFVTSERGIRTPRWNICASAWGIKDLNKDKLTLRDKLNDIKFIPLPVIKQIVN